MHHDIVLLSDLSYRLDLIGIAEYEERREIADWLSDGGKAIPILGLASMRTPSVLIKMRRDQKAMAQGTKEPLD